MPKTHILLQSTAQPRPIDPTAAFTLPKRAKARIVVDVLNGTAAFAWTAPTLAKLLGVCESYIAQERWAAARDQPAANPDLASAWEHASEAERDAFLRSIQTTFWETLDRVTAPATQPKPATNGPVARRRPNGHAREAMRPTITVHAAE